MTETVLSTIIENIKVKVQGTSKMTSLVNSQFESLARVLPFFARGSQLYELSYKKMFSITFNYNYIQKKIIVKGDFKKG